MAPYGLAEDVVGIDPMSHKFFIISERIAAKEQYSIKCISDFFML